MRAQAPLYDFPHISSPIRTPYPCAATLKVPALTQHSWVDAGTRCYS